MAPGGNTLGGAEHKVTWGGAPLPAIQSLHDAHKEVALQRFYLPKLREDMQPQEVLDRVTRAARGELSRPGSGRSGRSGRSQSSGRLRTSQSAMSLQGGRALSQGGHIIASKSDAGMQRHGSFSKQDWLTGPREKLGPVGRMMASGQGLGAVPMGMGPPRPGMDAGGLPKLIYGSRPW